MTIRMDFAALQNAAERIARASAYMNNELADLRTTVGVLAQAGGAVEAWSGDAQVEYGARQKEWDDASQALNAILTDLGKRVDAARLNMMSTEAGNTAKFAR